MKLFAASIAVAQLAIASGASAVGHESHLGVQVGGAALALSDKTDVGPGAGGYWTYGLSDEFNLMAEVAWSQVAFGEKGKGAGTLQSRPAGVADAAVGVGYVLDVLRWVPYAGALVGGYALEGGMVPNARVLPGAAIELGLDYRLDRSWAVGFAFRQHFLVTELSKYPSFTQLFARFEYAWGW